MKKRILALLLAGLMTASLAACTTDTSRENPEFTQGTSESTKKPGESETDPPVTATWTDVDEYVYVLDKNGLSLTAVDGGASAKAAKLEKLHRVKVSNTSRSVVEKDGKQYYADSAKLTTEDILGENFKTVDPAKTRYASTNGLNIREYADTSAPIVSGLSLNDAVQVIATGEVGEIGWSKIKLENGGFAFVSTKYLSDEKVIDPDSIDYSDKFTACTPKTMYVVVANSLALRKNANTDSTIQGYLKNGQEVTVIATGVVDDISWSRVKVADEIEEGQTPTYTVGYINASYLSEVPGGTELTLDDMMKLYPTFTKKTEPVTMYVSADKLNTRTSPEFPEDNGNVNWTLGLSKKDAVVVVAEGIVDDYRWAMIEHKNENSTAYYFVSAKNLTTDPNGEAIVSLDDLIAEYKFTKLDTPKTMYATAVINCNIKPANQDPSTVTKKLAKGDKVTVLAIGTVDFTNWCLFQIEGSDFYYFAGAELFSETQG